MYRRTSGIHRKEPVAMDELVQMFIKSMKLSAGLNTRRIYEAWDQASGASRYTLRRYFRDGKLYVTLNSSMVRNQLGFQKEALRERINGIPGCFVVASDAESLAGKLTEALAFEGRTQGRAAVVDGGLSNDGVASRIIKIYNSLVS